MRRVCFPAIAMIVDRLYVTVLNEGAHLGSAYSGSANKQRQVNSDCRTTRNVWIVLVAVQQATAGR